MLKAKIYNSIYDIESTEWDSIIGDDYLLKHSYLVHVERSLCTEYSYKYLGIYIDDEIVLATPLFTIDLDLGVMLEKGIVKSFIHKIRKIFKKAFYIKALVVGSPPSIGNFGVAIKKEKVTVEVMRYFLKNVKKIMKSQKRDMVLLKEIPEKFYEEYKYLMETEQFNIGWDMPNNYINVAWMSDEEYLKTLRKKYRQSIKTSHKKLFKDDIKVNVEKRTDVCIGNTEYEMFLNVLYKSEYIFEVLSYEYFREFVTVKELNSCIIAIKKGRKIIGYFLVCDTKKNEISALFAGLDYKWNHEYDVYFNLFHQVILYAISSGKKRISFGQNTYEVKQRMGCKIEELYIGFYHKNFMLNKIMGKFINIILPRTEIKEKKVLKEE